MPRVSVILNCFNHAPYVEEAVSSVLGQTFQDFELLAVDNGSTDATHAILRRYADDPRVRLFLHAENKPITSRFNQAIAAARGEFVAFIYSDDCYLPDKLERQVAAFDALPSDYGVVYAPLQGLNAVTGRRWLYGSIGASGYVLKDLFLRYERGQIDMISPLTRRVCLERYPFDESIFAEGEAVFFRIAMTYRFQYIDNPVAEARDHMANAGKATRRNADMTWAWLRTLAAHPSFPADHMSYLNRYRATLLRNYGWQTVRTGSDLMWARQCFFNSCRVAWYAGLHPRVIAGLALTLVPAVLRRRLNTWGNNLRRHQHNSVHVDDFGGSIGQG